jgi:hypothetical protein
MWKVRDKTCAFPFDSGGGVPVNHPPDNQYPVNYVRSVSLPLLILPQKTKNPPIIPRKHPGRAVVDFMLPGTLTRRAVGAFPTKCRMAEPFTVLSFVDWNTRTGTAIRLQFFFCRMKLQAFRDW